MTDTLVKTFDDFAARVRPALERLDGQSAPQPSTPVVEKPATPAPQPVQGGNLLPPELQEGRIPNNWQDVEAEVSFPAGLTRLVVPIFGEAWTGLRVLLDGQVNGNDRPQIAHLMPFVQRARA